MLLLPTEYISFSTFSESFDVTGSEEDHVKPRFAKVSVIAYRKVFDPC